MCLFTRFTTDCTPQLSGIYTSEFSKDYHFNLIHIMRACSTFLQLFFVLIELSSGFLVRNVQNSKSSAFRPLSMSGPSLHGSEQTRSPLCNWYIYENNIPFTQNSPRPSNHPFGQVPFLTDDGGVEVFESGAILLYLADKYGGQNTPEQRASYTKWVVWANSELDGLCFGESNRIQIIPSID